MQPKLKKNFDFLYNNNIILEDTLKNILHKMKYEIIPNNKYINMNAANSICQEIKDIICSNIKVFDNSILKCKEYDIYDKIINIIKKDKKINISNICDQNSSIDIFNHLIKIKISESKSIIIPIDYCTYFSPRDNIYYLIIEYLKHLSPNKEKLSRGEKYVQYSYIKLNSIFNFNPKYSSHLHYYKGKILYKNMCSNYKRGYVNISSTIEDMHLFKYKDCIDDQYNIIFNIDIYDNNNLLIDQIKCNYHDNNLTFTSLNNINIYFFGNIFTKTYNYDYYTANEICNNIDVFLKYIYNGFIPNLGYFNYVKDTRKNMINSHSYAFGTIKDKVKYDIDLVTCYMKKYRKIMNIYIYQKILLIIWCLEKYNIILPVEVWCIICSYFVITPNIDIH